MVEHLLNDFCFCYCICDDSVILSSWFSFQQIVIKTGEQFLVMEQGETNLFIKSVNCSPVKVTLN